MAEWLRYLTRNQIPSRRVSSNPTDCEILLGAVLINLQIKDLNKAQEWVIPVN